MYLSNGQTLSIYFNRHRDRRLTSCGISAAWSVGIYIGATHKEANKWYNSTSKESEKITGKCGLEGLKKALDIILDFRNEIKTNEILVVWGTDQRRMNAYRRLGKYGFVYFYLGEEFVGCATYHPDSKLW